MGASAPLHGDPPGTALQPSAARTPTSLVGGCLQHPSLAWGDYIIPTEGELSRELEGFAIDPLGGAVDNGRSALLGAFLWPQRRRRRQKQWAAAQSVRWLCWGSLRGPIWAWTTSGGRVRGSPEAPRAERARTG